MSDLARDEILVACVGNAFLGDDAFGVQVAQVVDGLDLPEQAAVVDYGIRSLDLAYALLEPWRAVVIVDAMARGGSPGDLYLVELDRNDDAGASVDPRAMDPARVVALARTLGEITAPVYIVGCEPAGVGDRFAGESGLSAPVTAAVPEAARMIDRLIRQLLPEAAGVGPRP